MKLLILGGDGQLGAALKAAYGEAAVACGRNTLDITNTQQIAARLDSDSFDIVLNAAAYNRVDEAEDAPEIAYQVNALGPRNLALACQARKIQFLHVSTDYVFDGQKSRRPWQESDSPNPRNAYGVSKLAGEYFVRSLCERHFVVRTCGLYGHAARGRHGNIVETFLRLGTEKEQLSVVNDQFCTPTAVSDLVLMIKSLVRSKEYGLYHATNSGSCSWAEFAIELLRLSGIETPVNPIPSSEYPTKANRPAYSVLNCNKLETTLSLTRRSWQTALAEYMTERNKITSG